MERQPARQNENCRFSSPYQHVEVTAWVRQMADAALEDLSARLQLGSLSIQN